MNMKFELNQFTQCDPERPGGPIVLVAEASELRLPPGQWPETVQVGHRFFGEREPIILRGIVGYRYIQTDVGTLNRCEVKIFND